MAIKIPKGSRVLVDMRNEGMVFGDHILRVGALKIFQKNCNKLFVVSARHELLRRVGIKNAIPKDSIETILDAVDYIVAPPDWTGSPSRKEGYGTGKTVINGLLNCDYFSDTVTQEERKDYPFLNRITINFLNQIKEKTQFDFLPYELIPTATGPVPKNSTTQILAIGDAANKENRCWPHYADAINRLSEKFPKLNFAFVDMNTYFTKEIIEQLEHPDRVIYSAKLDNPLLCESYISQANAFLGNDSGPAHYFSMMNHGKKPVLTISARLADPDRWAPNGFFTDYIYLDENKAPRCRCNYLNHEWQKTRDNPSGYDISDVPVEYVVEKMAKMQKLLTFYA